MSKQPKRIGILTGGGDCPGLNAVIRAVVKTLVVEHGCDVIGFRDGFKGLVESNFVELDEKAVSGILAKGGTILGTSNRDNPFNFPVLEGSKRVYKDFSDRAVKNAQILGVDSIIVIGGDGSLAIAHELEQKGLKVIGVPKTIDNDLLATDFTFGFNTALATAVDALDKLHTTAESHHRVMILEVMGRYAGWIALEAGIAGGADVILIPELPYDLKKVCKKVMDRKNSGKNFSVIVTAEAAKQVDGDMIIRTIIEGSTDPVRLGGVGDKLAHDIESMTQIESRVTVLGHLQRGGIPIAFDRILSTRYGVAAAHLAAKQKYGQMVCLRGTKISSVEIKDAIKNLKKVDVDGELVKVAKSLGISFG